MAKRNRTQVWIAVASVSVLAFVGVLLLAEEGERVSASDMPPDMPVEEALRITEDTCMSAASEWAAVNQAGNDRGIPRAVRASARCERNASAVLAGASPRVWANRHCRAVVEGWRDVARWQIDQGPKVFPIKTEGQGAVAPEIAAQHQVGLALMATVQYQRRMCEQQGVVD